MQQICSSIVFLLYPKKNESHYARRIACVNYNNYIIVSCLECIKLKKNKKL